MKCKLCDDPATDGFRCEKHNRCDDCGTREELCHYTEGCLCPLCHTKRVDDRIAAFDGNTAYTSEITCPHCGYRESDSWEFEDSEYECSDCGRSYGVQRNVTVDYSTYKV